MLAMMSQQAPAMSLSASHSSSPKRPRLSLQTKPAPLLTTVNPGAALKADIDPTSATAFNTLSNAYAAAIELSSPKVASSQSSFASKKLPNPVRKVGLRLVTNADSGKTTFFPSQHTRAPGLLNFTYPDKTNAGYSVISPITANPNPRINIPSFTFTPPQSAHPSDESEAKIFSFPSHQADIGTPISPMRTPRRRTTTGNQNSSAPYTHPRSLHSILRNSPLPSRSSLAPSSPSYPSRRLVDRGVKKLCFNDPLTQTITTQRYIKSHIDLLTEEASPHTAVDPEGPETLDLTMAYTGDETRDGGQTPGPFEEMRRRMAGLGADSPGAKKRKRKEKKRQWVWTIGVNEDELDREELGSEASSRSESPETQDHAQNTANNSRGEDTNMTPVTAISLPSETMGEGSVTEIKQQPEATNETPLIAILRPDVSKPKLAVRIETLPEPGAPPIEVHFNGDTEMVDQPDAAALA